jgi:DNA-binding response OmpR family regulator
MNRELRPPSRAPFRSYEYDLVKILLVEDSRLVAIALQRLLRGRGWQLMIAPNCSNARRVAAETIFSVAIVDLGLPDGSGVELGQWLLSTGRCAKVVFHTGEHGDSPEVQRARAFGRVVGKHDQPNKLIAAIAEPARIPA